MGEEAVGVVVAIQASIQDILRGIAEKFVGYLHTI